MNARQALVTTILSLLMVTTIFLDAYAHQHLIDTETEDFFTLWHALFYGSAFLYTAWVVKLVLRRRPSGSWTLELSPATKLAAIGVALVVVGGLGDMAWHSVFGLEKSLDALFSPTHLVIAAGLVSSALPPYESFRRSNSTARTEAVAAAGSILVATSIIALVLVAIWGVDADWWPRTAYYSENDAGRNEVIAGLGSMLVSTGVLISAALTMCELRRRPPGAILTMFVLVNSATAFSIDRWRLGIVVAGLAGVAFELGLRALGPTGTPRWITGIRWVAVAATAIMWLTFFGFVSITGSPGVVWPAEIWTGSIVFCCALTYYVTKIRQPAIATHEQPQ